MYKPRPIDPGPIELPRPLAELLEVLARNTHDVWSAGRLAEGWKLGSKRDDAAKTHPNLVDYSELSEADKDYDRRTSLGVLKVMLALGWRLEPPTASKDGAAGLRARASAPAADRARGLLGAGDPLAAYDLLAGALETFPGDARLRQLLALSLSRAGATERAKELLTALYDEGHRDEETLAMLGAAYKKLGELERAHGFYAESFRRHGKYYSAINAATLSLLLGDRKSAQSMARAVRRLCKGSDYWVEATLGEAALVLGELDAAKAHYGRAAGIGRGRWGDLASTGRQAEAILAHLGLDPAQAKAWLPVPAVSVFGAELGGFAFAAPVDRAEIEFLERAAAAGAETNVVLPLRAETWSAWVRKRLGAGWSRRLDAALARAARVTVADEHAVAPSDVVTDFARRTAEGLARLKAESIGAPLLRPKTPARRIACAGSQRVMAMLFADAVGYSKLADDQIPKFVREFMRTVAETTRTGRGKPEVMNTWGDALYFVFSDVETAGLYSLRLRDRVAATDWKKRGLPAALSFRIALHAGPVYPCKDPVTGQPTYVGSHVSRAARIEPVTPPGQVYASQPFAALAAEAHVRSFSCEYVGQVPLAKKYGAFPLYHVRRRSA